jgi:hypothetical protein
VGATLIPSASSRGDLADRAIAVTLPAIPDERRRPEAEVWREFDAAAPGVLALLLDALAMALRDGPGLRLARLPRMADFARIACAAAPASGWTAEGMLNAIEANRRGAVAGVIEADPVAVAVQELAAEVRTWSGTATKLLEEINQRTPTDRQRMRDWPRDATRLSGRLRRAAPALRRAGVEVSLPEAGGRAGRIITIARKADQRSERSERSATPEPAAELGSAGTQRNAGAPGQRSERRDAGNAAAVSAEAGLDEVVL